MSDTPLEEPPDILLEDDSEVKPFIVPQNIPTENFTGAGVCAVEMKPLTFWPASTTPTPPTPRLQTARHGKPFIQLGVARLRTCIHKLDKESEKQVNPKKKTKTSTEESSSNQGDALVELEETTYTEWLAEQGLVNLGEEEETVQLNIQVEDISDLEKGTDTGDLSGQEEVKGNLETEEKTVVEPQAEEKEVKEDEQIKEIPGDSQTVVICKKHVSPVQCDKPKKPPLKRSQRFEVTKVSEDKDNDKGQTVSKDEIPLKVSEKSQKAAVCKMEVSQVKLDKKENKDKCDKNVDEERSDSKTKDAEVKSYSPNKVAVGNSDSDTPTTKLVRRKEEIKENPSVVQEAEKAEGNILEGETSRSENDQEKVSDNLEEVGMVDTMEEEKKEETDGKIRKIRDSVERELEESDEFNSSQDNLVIDEQDTKKDKHVSFTLPEEVNVSFEESAQRGNTDDFVRADEMQQHSESTKDVFGKEQEGSTEDKKYIDLMIMRRRMMIFH